MSTDYPREDSVRMSSRMVAYHRQAYTMPPTIIRQCDAARNHGQMEGVWA